MKFLFKLHFLYMTYVALVLFFWNVLYRSVFAVFANRGWERWTIQFEEYYLKYWIRSCIARRYNDCVRLFANVHQRERNGKTEEVSMTFDSETKWQLGSQINYLGTWSINIWAICHTIPRNFANTKWSSSKLVCRPLLSHGSFHNILDFPKVYQNRWRNANENLFFLMNE